MILQPHETDLVGRWERKQGRTVEDATASRIKSLVKNTLVKLGSDSTGWDVLYRDPNDGRLWELTYPQSASHGGGPPRLSLLETQSARTKYGDVVEAS